MKKKEKNIQRIAAVEDVENIVNGGKFQIICHPLRNSRTRNPQGPIRGAIIEFESDLR
jgi:hypothetical protein